MQTSARDVFDVRALFCIFKPGTEVMQETKAGATPKKTNSRPKTCPEREKDGFYIRDLLTRTLHRRDEPTLMRGNARHRVTAVAGGDRSRQDGAGGGACNRGTDLALPSLWHQSRWGGGERQPGLVARAVEPGALDLVVTGQGRVTIPPVYESGVPRDFVLVGDEIPQALRGNR